MSPLTLLIIGLPRGSSSGYRCWGQIEWTHHFGSAGTAGRLGILLEISQIFAISCQLSRALAISKTTHCIRLSTADKGQEYG